MSDSLTFEALLAAVNSPLMLVAVLVYFIAGVVKGTLGIGFPTTAVSLLAQVTDVRSAISLVVIPMVVTNAWQVYRNRRIVWVLSQFWVLLLCNLLFIAIFSQLVSTVPVSLLTAILGIIVTLYAATSLYKPVLTITDNIDRPAQVVAGVVSGAMGGMTGVWAPPFLIYLSARKISKEQFVSTTGLLLCLGSSVLFAGYAHSGLLPQLTIAMSCLLLIPSLAGFSLGEQLRKRMSAQRFERALLWFFLLMGLNLIRRAWL